MSDSEYSPSDSESESDNFYSDIEENSLESATKSILALKPTYIKTKNMSKSSFSKFRQQLQKNKGSEKKSMRLDGRKSVEDIANILSNFFFD